MNWVSQNLFTEKNKNLQSVVQSIKSLKLLSGEKHKPTPAIVTTYCAVLAHTATKAWQNISSLKHMAFSK